MPIVPFPNLMRDADQGEYAVGYFECWNLESALAVANAAEGMRSPVLLGFSGIYLPHASRLRHEHLADYAALGLEICRRLTVPSCLVFNESPHLDWVNDAIELGFGLVMFTDEHFPISDQTAAVRKIVARAHTVGAAVEGELTPLAGVGGKLETLPDDLQLTTVKDAREFVAKTNIDALAVNIGQAHLHGRMQVRLNLERLSELRAAVSVPLVLHGATSIERDDLRAAVRLGVRKVNVGSALKRAYFEALRVACAGVREEYNPYDVIGSGLAEDVLTAGRVAMQKEVEEWVTILQSAGRA